MLDFNTIAGVSIPFVGTTLGAAMVFFMKDKIHPLLQKALLGFSSGVMMAASVWSLLIPAMDLSTERGMGKFSFLPAISGLLIGILLLLLFDRLIPHLHLNQTQPEGPKSSLQKTTMMILAVAIHNLPEDGSRCRICRTEKCRYRGNSCLCFCSLCRDCNSEFPRRGNHLHATEIRRDQPQKIISLRYAFRSGGTVWGNRSNPALRFSDSTPSIPAKFAAGAMIYVIVEEIIPEASEGTHSNIATIGFAVGFCVMMILDVALG